MADNTQLPATGTGTADIIVATDKIGGVDYQRTKVVWGADGTATDASAAAPLPVVQTGTPALPTGAAADATLTANGVLIGAVTETAPATDTASSGLNGRLQRIAQRLTSILAKLPALGTAGSASSDVITVQGIASMTAVKVDGSGVTQPVSGTVTATVGTVTAVTSITNVVHVDDNSGSLTVDNGGTFAVQAAQSGTWNVTNVSGTVSLPTGAATAAKQPALGTAGTASADVITVQGKSSMTPLLVDGSGVTQPVSGTFWQATQPVSGTVTANAGTNLNTSALALDATLSTTNTDIGGLTESAPATDTASSGLNGRLQRVAQRLTSIIALLPASLGQKTKAGSLAVTLASDQDALPITDNSGSLTVDGTVAATQSGTWTVQPGNTANSTAWKVDASSVAVPVTDNSGSLTVDGTFWQATQPVSGTVAISGTVAATQSGTWQQLALGSNSTVNLNQIAGVTPSVSSGNKDTGTLRVTLATDQVQLTNRLLTSATVDAALPAGSNAIGKLAANDGVDIGDVTVNNASGASAVNVQDGGNSLTVDNGGTFAVQAAQSGTWTVQPGNTPNTTAWKVDGSAVTQPVSGTFWQATQPVSGTVAISGTVAATQSGTWQNLALGSNSTVNLNQIAGTAASVNSGTKDAGTLRVTLATDQVQLTNALKVDGSAVTQPVSGTVTVTQGTATNLKVDASGVAVPITDNSGSLTVDNGGTFAVQANVNQVGSVSVSSNGLPIWQGSPPHNFGYNLKTNAVQLLTSSTGTDLLTVTAGKTLAITDVQLQAGGTVGGPVQIYFGTGTFTRGTNRAIFDGEFAPSATLRPGVVRTGLWVAGGVSTQLRIATPSSMTLFATAWGYEF